jgi:hypothetical protein
MNNQPTQIPSLKIPTAQELTVQQKAKALITSLSDPKSFYNGLQAKTVRDNFLTGGPCLSAISSTLGEPGPLVVQALLNVIIADITTFFNIGKGMNDQQIIQTGQLIAEKYNYFKPEDFKLCFKRAKQGDYGTLYDRLDGQVIMGWLQQYDSERDNEVEQIRIAEHKAVIIESGEWLPENRNKYIEVLTKVKERVEAPVKAPLPPMNPIQQMHNRWMNQFTKLANKQNSIGKISKVRFVNKYGKKMDINEYLQYKQNQYNQYAAR